jgi:hypothetical protein
MSRKYLRGRQRTPAMMRKAGERLLPHPTRYLGADVEIKLSRDEAPP